MSAETREYTPVALDGVCPVEHSDVRDKPALRNELLEKHLLEFVALGQAGEGTVDTASASTPAVAAHLDRLIGNFDADIEGLYAHSNLRERDPDQLEYIISRCLRSTAYAAVSHHASNAIMEDRLTDHLALPLPYYAADDSVQDTLDTADAPDTTSADAAFRNLLGGWYTDAINTMFGDPRFTDLLALYERAHERCCAAIDVAIQHNGGTPPRYIPPTKSSEDALLPRTYKEHIWLGLEDVVGAVQILMREFHDALRPRAELDIALRESRLFADVDGQGGGGNSEEAKRLVAAEIGDAAFACVPALLPLASIGAEALRGVYAGGRFMEVTYELEPDEWEYDVVVEWLSPHMRRKGWSPPGYCTALLAMPASDTAVRFIDQVSMFSFAERNQECLSPYKVEQSEIAVFLMLGAWAARTTIFYAEMTPLARTMYDAPRMRCEVDFTSLPLLQM